LTDRKNLKNHDKTNGGFFIGLVLGLMCFFIQFQFELPIETWLWIIGIIAIIYMLLMAFILVLATFSFGFVGFLVGVMISLFIFLL